MGADTTANKNRRMKYNEHDNHSRKTPVWKRRQAGGKIFVGTYYGLLAHPMSMINTVGKYLLGNGDRW